MLLVGDNAVEINEGATKTKKPTNLRKFVGFLAPPKGFEPLTLSSED